MVLKDFRCRVSSDMFDRFSAEQLRWNALRSEAGFVVQCGGRAASDPVRVQIFGVWADIDAYRRFMSQVHDLIFEGGSQGDCYHKAQSALYEPVFDLPGNEQDLSGALGHDPAMIRIARCAVRPDRVEHFVEMQRKVWMPGMKSAPGMLGGGFWRSVDDEHQFIVTTAWASMEDHERYRHEQLPTLRDSANPDDDLEMLDGDQIVLIPAWTVLP